MPKCFNFWAQNSNKKEITNAQMFELLSSKLQRKEDHCSVSAYCSKTVIGGAGGIISSIIVVVIIINRIVLPKQGCSVHCSCSSSHW